MGWGLSTLRKAIDPTPTPWSLSDQSGGLDPPRLKGRGLISQYFEKRDHAKHIGGAPAGCRNLAVMPGRNPAPI
jgi:hypothetical protein